MLLKNYPITHYLRFYAAYIEWYIYDPFICTTCTACTAAPTTTTCTTSTTASSDDNTTIDNTLIEQGYILPPPHACLSPAVSEVISTTTKSSQFAGIAADCGGCRVVMTLAQLWMEVCEFISYGDIGYTGEECPFVYLFVKYALDQGWGVPKLALALYDRMNMQLSREFIRCANPTCELNRLDKSSGQVKFKKCSRCMSVIYCSRECQVAHYPEHKRLCRKRATG